MLLLITMVYIIELSEWTVLGIVLSPYWAGRGQPASHGSQEKSPKSIISGAVDRSIVLNFFCRPLITSRYLSNLPFVIYTSIQNLTWYHTIPKLLYKCFGRIPGLCFGREGGITLSSLQAPTPFLS